MFAKKLFVSYSNTIKKCWLDNQQQKWEKGYDQVGKVCIMAQQSG